MKKHYIFLLAAGILSCMSVNAKNETGKRVSHWAGNGMNIKNAQIISKPQLLTKASATVNADSLVLVNPDGERYWKEIYSYDKEGRIEKVEEFSMDESQKWKSLYTHTYMYNDHGWLSAYINIYDDGTDREEQKYTYSYEGNKGTYTVEYISTWNFNGINRKGNTIYDEQGRCVSAIEYALIDVNGDGKIDAADNKEDGSEPWYKNNEITYEYDDLGRYLKINTTYYYLDEISSKQLTSNVWDGNSYIQTVSIEYPEDEETDMEYYKYEEEAGNPKIGFLYEKEDKADEWELKQKEFSYYPKGSETANEAIGVLQDVNIIAANGMIQISTSESLPVQVYTIVGQCVYDATINGNAIVTSLKNGIYVVHAGQKVVKVSIH